jgi:hypothetical protein
MLKKMIRPVSFLLVLSFLLLDFNLHTAQAQMVGTSAVIEEQQEATNREQVASFLAREDVKQIMIQYGVDTIEAQNRVDSLTNAELERIAKSMDQLPAGGDGIGTIVGAAVLVFLILLITDILGFTHVFPFVKSQR